MPFVQEGFAPFNELPINRIREPRVQRPIAPLRKSHAPTDHVCFFSSWLQHGSEPVGKLTQ